MTFLTNLSIKTTIYQNFYALKISIHQISIIKISIFQTLTSLLRLTPLNCSFIHKTSIFLLSTSTGLGGFLLTIFLLDFNDFLVFFLSFPIELGGFSLIDLSGFFSQFSYLVRRFFHKDRIIMFLLTTYYQLFNFLSQLFYKAKRFFINWSS